MGLPSGGSIVIDATEALVAIDVNSGKTMGEGDIERTAFKANMEATSEIARQLRLRDLGGLIVIDLIDMREKGHIREVEKNLKEALSKDKARVNLSRISKFGLLEMSRQRIKTTLGEKSHLPCPYCQGSGQLKRVEALAIAFLRKLEAGLAREDVGKAEGETAQETALYLLNEKRAVLAELEKKYKTTIIVKGRPELKPDTMEITFQKMEKSESLKSLVEEAKSAQNTEDTAKSSLEVPTETQLESPGKPVAPAKEEGHKKSGSRKSSRKNQPPNPRRDSLSPRRPIQRQPAPRSSSATGSRKAARTGKNNSNRPEAGD